MAKIKVKLFGVFRVDTHTPEVELDADRMKDVFSALNEKLGNIQMDSGLEFKDAVVYLNGESCRKKSAKLKDGDEIWLLSPASGG
ncbi:MAG: MoaD/ThiS family protein [Clostridia bacterium]|nr:MoaD/ThiS family protein [Clostridia bacterium]